MNKWLAHLTRLFLFLSIFLGIELFAKEKRMCYQMSNDYGTERNIYEFGA